MFGAAGAQRVTNAAMLAAWEQACRGGMTDERLFPPAMLQEPDHAVVAATRDGTIIGGCIATRSDGVLGISNLFAPAEDDGTCYARRASTQPRVSSRPRRWSATNTATASRA